MGPRWKCLKILVSANYLGAFESNALAWSTLLLKTAFDKESNCVYIWKAWLPKWLILGTLGVHGTSPSSRSSPPPQHVVLGPPPPTPRGHGVFSGPVPRGHSGPRVKPPPGVTVILSVHIPGSRWRRGQLGLSAALTDETAGPVEPGPPDRCVTLPRCPAAHPETSCPWRGGQSARSDCGCARAHVTSARTHAHTRTPHAGRTAVPETGVLAEVRACGRGAGREGAGVRGRGCGPVGRGWEGGAAGRPWVPVGWRRAGPAGGRGAWGRPCGGRAPGEVSVTAPGLRRASPPSQVPSRSGCRTCSRTCTTAGRWIRPSSRRRTEWSSFGSDTTGTPPVWRWTRFSTASPRR